MMQGLILICVQLLVLDKMPGIFAQCPSIWRKSSKEGGAASLVVHECTKGRNVVKGVISRRYFTVRCAWRKAVAASPKDAEAMRYID